MRSFPVILMLLACTCLSAQQNKTGNSGVPSNAPRMQMPPMPKPGVCPLPILPALPTYSDSSYCVVQSVPHGTVSEVNYKTSTGVTKRMHIYLPPDYDKNKDIRYPVLYLNHGGGDDDSKWTDPYKTNGGCANTILDNLIASGKAKPMIIVMPNTKGIAAFESSPVGTEDKCTAEYLHDIIPYIDSHYRSIADRKGRAIAGLSMGGFVVLHTGFPHLDTFSELYIYSSGHISPESLEKFSKDYASILSDPGTNDLLRVPVYFAAGETDIALNNCLRLLAVFNTNTIRNFWVLSNGGHEWANWRRYLYQSSQIMFPENCQK